MFYVKDALKFKRSASVVKGKITAYVFYTSTCVLFLDLRRYLPSWSFLWGFLL